MALAPFNINLTENDAAVVPIDNVGAGDVIVVAVVGTWDSGTMTIREDLGSGTGTTLGAYTADQVPVAIQTCGVTRGITYQLTDVVTASDLWLNVSIKSRGA